MHDDEIEVGIARAMELISQQIPSLADESLWPVPSNGTDNAMFRVGERHVARFPRIDWAREHPVKEFHWLGLLNGALSVETPRPVALGQPGSGYPWHWLVTSWIDGTIAADSQLGDQFADELVDMIRSLHQLQFDRYPTSSRGVSLVERDVETRSALARCTGVDVERLTTEWSRAVRAGAPPRPVLIHGDLSAGNLVVNGGHLVGLIDFGTLTSGDPACDLLPAWNLLDAAHRRRLRETLGVDDATWLRGRGWALSVAAIQLPYYEHRNEYIARSSRRVLSELLEDRE